MWKNVISQWFYLPFCNETVISRLLKVREEGKVRQAG
jgi:hypothetical protein